MEKTFDRSAAFIIFKNEAINFSNVKRVYTCGCFNCADIWYKTIEIEFFDKSFPKQLNVFCEADEDYIDEVFSKILDGLLNNTSVDLRLEEKTLKIKNGR